MSKVKLEFKVPENKKINHNGIDIELTPVLTMAQQVFLINAYVKNYFFGENHSVIDGTETNFFEAEYGLKNLLFQFLTNIDVENSENDIYVDGQLWEKVTSEILNYADFKKKLDYVVQEIKEQNTLKNSIGSVMSGLIAKGYEVLTKFSEANPEEIKKSSEAVKELIEKLEKSTAFPLLSEKAK